MADTPGRRLRRRLVTFPAMAAALVLVWALSPALFVAAGLADLARGGRGFVTIRLVVFAMAFVVIENLGLLRLLATGATTRAGTPARLARTYAAQRFYTGALLAAVKVIFQLKFVVEDGELAATGPYVVFMRHAAVVDVLVPGGFIANAHEIELRYILKRELLVEPALDLAGNWIPNHFVDRSGADTKTELAAIAALKAGLGPRQAVLVYPEGTRFSPALRASLLGKLEGEPLARAKELTHLLPIRPGGALTLLAAPPTCDVVFVGHHGLEGLTRVRDVWRKGLLGQTITVKFWRVPAAEIPAGDDARLRWLHGHWRRVDAWLEGFEGGRDAPPPDSEAQSAS